MAEDENRAAVERLWRAFAAREFERAGDEVHEDVVVDWPHSGERIRGRAAFIAVNRDHPDPWITVELRRIVAEGDFVVTEVAVPVAGAATVYAASFFELQDGKVRKLTEYWVDGGSQLPYESRAGISESIGGVTEMASTREDGFDEPMEEEQEEREDDPGFLGGGGPAAATDDAEETLDEHGDNLATADEEKERES